MVDYETDGEFLYGTRKTIDYLINQGVTVYQYIFSYVGEQNTGCQFGHCGLGVCHGEELQYIWKSEPKWGKGWEMFHRKDLFMDFMHSKDDFFHWQIFIY